MRNLFFLLSSGNRGGAQSVVCDLSSEASCYNVIFISGENITYLEDIPLHDFGYKVLPGLSNTSGPIDTFRAFSYLFSLCFKSTSSIFHAHNTKAGILVSLLSIFFCFPNLFINHKFIRTIHGWGWRGLPPIKASVTYIVELFLSLFPSPVSYVFVSLDTYQSRPWFFAKKNHVVYNGFNTPSSHKYTAAVFSHLNARECHKVSNAPLSLLMPARFDQSKDHQTLFAALSMLDIPFTLHLCGSGTNSAGLHELLKRYPAISPSQVIIYGEISRTELFGLYLSSDIFLLVSNYEALPMSIIEAMAFSLPIIATNCGGVSELCKHGHNGLLVEKKSIIDLSNTISFLYNNPSYTRRLSINARSSYLQSFTVKRMFQSYKLIYD